MELSPNVEGQKLYDVTMANQDLNGHSTNTSGDNMGAYHIQQDDFNGDFSPPENGVGIKRAKKFSDSDSEGSPKKRQKPS